MFSTTVEKLVTRKHSSSVTPDDGTLTGGVGYAPRSVKPAVRLSARRDEAAESVF